MKNKLYISILVLALTIVQSQAKAQSQGWQWAKSAGGTYSEVGRSIATDAWGNVYVIGYFESSSITFGTITLTNTSGGTDIFLVKYDAKGNVIWAKNAVGHSGDHGLSVATDVFGNVFVTGSFESTKITFGTTTLTNYYSGRGDIFLAKYDSSGKVLWAKSAGGLNNEGGLSLATDASGNVYLTGIYGSSSITIGTTTLTNTNSPGTNIFLAKYDAKGNAIWAKSAAGQYSHSVATDGYGNVYITGRFGDSITFGTSTLTGKGSNDIFLVKYDAKGNVIWAKSAGDFGWDDARGISTDASGNVYITGYFESSSITFGTDTLSNSGNYDMFLAKYDSSGNVIWAKSASGTNFEIASSVSIDTSGNIYVTGHSNSDSITFGNETLTNAGFYDIFLVKYDSSGNVLLAKSAGGNDRDEAYSISSDASGNAYVTGYFNSDSITMGASTLTNKGNFDIFIVKLGNCSNTTSSQNVTSCNSYSWNSKTYKVSGTYVDTISNAKGCDSIMTLNLTINNSTTSAQNATSCDTFVWHSKTYTVSGTYTDTVPNAAGCDSIMILNLTINAPPVVNLVLNPDTVCSNTAAYQLSGGSPAGGTYSGPGVNSGIFDPSAAGPGLHNISYTYSDLNTCTESITTQIFVDICTGIEDAPLNKSFVIFPNPFSAQAVLESDQPLQNATITVVNLFGQTVKHIQDINGHSVVFSRGKLASGLYFVRLTQNNILIAIRKIVIVD